MLIYKTCIFTLIRYIFISVCRGNDDISYCQLLNTVKYLKTFNGLALQNFVLIMIDPYKISPMLCNGMALDLISSRENMLTMNVVLVNSNTTSILTSLRSMLTCDVPSIVIFVESSFSRDLLFGILKGISKKELSSNAWLILADQTRYGDTPGDIFSSNILSLFDDMENLQFDSQTYILAREELNFKLFEAYRACSNTSTIFRHLPHMMEGNGPAKQLHKNYIWERRKNLEGCKLRATFIPTSSAFHYKNENRNKDKSSLDTLYSNELMYSSSVEIDGTEFFGTSADVFRILMDEMNFTLEAVIPDQKSYGVYDTKTKTWNGIIGVIAENRAEFSLNDLTVTHSRSEVANFVAPIYFQCKCISEFVAINLYLWYSIKLQTSKFSTFLTFIDNMLFMKQPQPSLSWTTFLSVFSYRYWLVLCAITIVGIVVLAYAIYIYEDRPAKSDSHVLYKTGSAITYIFISVLNLDTALVHNAFCNSTTSLSSKIFVLTFCIYGYLNLAVYQGGLTASLTLKTVYNPIKTLEDLLSNPSYSLIVTEGSSDQSYFSEATGTTVASHVWDKLLANRPGSFVKNGKEAQEELRLDSRKVFFASKHDVEIVLDYYPCLINTESEKYSESQGGFPFRMDSPYQKLFKEKINNIVEFGEWRYAREEAKRRKVNLGCDLEDEGYGPMGYRNSLSLFVFTVLWIILSILICLAETRHKKTTRK